MARFSYHKQNYCCQKTSDESQRIRRNLVSYHSCEREAGAPEQYGYERVKIHLDFIADAIAAYVIVSHFVKPRRMLIRLFYHIEWGVTNIFLGVVGEGIIAYIFQPFYNRSILRIATFPIGFC